MATHQALPSLGFSRQEYCSGLPFPSPMHESEKWKMKVKSFSCVRLFATPWTAAHQAPLPMGFSRQEYLSGSRLPSPSQSLVDHKLVKYLGRMNCRNLTVRRRENPLWNGTGHWPTRIARYKLEAYGSLSQVPRAIPSAPSNWYKFMKIS